MKPTRTAFVLGLAALVPACGDDPVTVDIADLAGAWTGTQFEFTDNTYPQLSIDAINDIDGSSLNLTIQESGAFTGTLRVPDFTVDPQTGETVTISIGGTFSIEGSILIVDFNAATEAYGFFGDFEARFTLNGDILTFVNEDSSFDFPDDIEQAFGAPARGEVSVTLTVQLVR